MPNKVFTSSPNNFRNHNKLNEFFILKKNKWSAKIPNDMKNLNKMFKFNDLVNFFGIQFFKEHYVLYNNDILFYYPNVNKNNININLNLKTDFFFI
jgi:hypothetical protein